MNDVKKQIYFLRNYNWEKGTLIKENKKTYTIELPEYLRSFCNNKHYKNVQQNFPKEKCAFPDELVCIVWECWKGKNGRGGYRVEKELYPDLRVPAKNVYYQHSTKRNSGRINESSFGITPNTEDFYIYWEKHDAVFDLTYFFTLCCQPF